MSNKTRHSHAGFWRRVMNPAISTPEALLVLLMVMVLALSNISEGVLNGTLQAIDDTTPVTSQPILLGQGF